MRNVSIRFFSRKFSLVCALTCFTGLTLAAAAQGTTQQQTSSGGRTTVALAMPAGVPDPPAGLSAGGVRRWIQLWTEVRQIEKMLKDSGYNNDQLNSMLASRLEEIRRLIRGR